MKGEIREFIGVIRGSSTNYTNMTNYTNIELVELVSNSSNSWINIEAIIAYINKAEELSGRKIRHLVLKCEERDAVLKQFPEKLLLYGKTEQAAIS